MSKQNILAALPASGDFSHRKLRYYVPEHMVTASAYFYICIFVVPSLGHQQHWTPVGGCNADSSEAKGVASMLLATNSTYEPPSVVFFSLARVSLGNDESVQQSRIVKRGCKNTSHKVDILFPNLSILSPFGKMDFLEVSFCFQEGVEW